MYEIKCSIGNECDLNNFMIKTSNFSKRFYTLDRFVTDDYGPHMDIKAIAISRDLTYIVTWHICCDKKHWEERVEEHKKSGFDVDEYEIQKAYMPVYTEHVKMWLPLLENDNYIDVFEYNGFVKVDSIKKEGAW